MGFEKNFKTSGYLGEAKTPEFFAAQKNAAKAREGAIKKELAEDSIGKASVLELLTDRLVGQLSLPENYKIIDEAVGEEGATQELADRLWKYGGKLGSKNIIYNNNLVDMIRGLCSSFVCFVDRAKRKGLSEEYVRIIAEDFNNLRDYLELLEKHSDFEKEELSSIDGFLSNVLGRKKMEGLNKTAKIKKCREILEGRKEK